MCKIRWLLFLLCALCGTVYNTEKKDKPLYTQKMTVKQQVTMMQAGLGLEDFSVREIKLAVIRSRKGQWPKELSEQVEQEIMSQLAQEFPGVMFNAQERNNAVYNSCVMTRAFCYLQKWNQQKTKR